MERYEIEAKRRNTDEGWSAWDTAKNFYKALEHAEYVEKVGYKSRLVVHPEVKEMWEILGNEGDVKVTTDAIFDAGFRKESVVKESVTKSVTKNVAKKILSEIRKAAEQYDAPPEVMHTILALEVEYGLKRCRMCRYVDECECPNGTVCERFEKKKRAAHY